MTKTAVKILITGDVGAGKTEFIRTISEIDIVSTDRRTSDEYRELKDETTVAMDFGRLTVDEELVLHLFGTPGQVRFDFMWEILSMGMLGYIILFDSSRPDTSPSTRRIIDFFEELGNVPFVIAANKQDLEGALSPEDVSYILALDGKRPIPVLPCRANDRGDVKRVLLQLFHEIAAGVPPD
ncbi:MAG: ATP/GTP-binding protein [Candidatus Zixiibacteriota bacterium]|jgi:small GTP-binding protein